jgi:hypothetical protein
VTTPFEEISSHHLKTITHFSKELIHTVGKTGTIRTQASVVSLLSYPATKENLGQHLHGNNPPLPVVPCVIYG